MEVEAPTVIGSGVYDLYEAAYLLGMDDRTVVRWSRPSARGKTALVAPSHGWAFSFHDLVSLAVVAVMRQRGVTPDGVRHTIAALQDEFTTPRPLAHRDIVRSLETAGRSVLRDGVDLTAGGQLAMIETVRAYLKPIQYGSNLLARLWKPARYVTLNPEIQAGRPCIVGTRVTTDVVASRLQQGEPVEVVAEDLEISVRHARAALRWEQRLESGSGLALVA